MFSFYLEVWREIPFLLKLAISGISLCFFGYSISPLSVASSVVFSIDQQQACELQFNHEISRVNSFSGPNSSDAAFNNLNDCKEKISLHPGFF